jgi:putative heme-binding domain-containing protein
MMRLMQGLAGLLLLTTFAATPVALWPAGPLEVRVAFDRPIDVAGATALVDKTIAFGPRRLGEDSGASPQGTIRIAAASLADEGRTLVLATDPHPLDAVYQLKVPVSGRMLELAYVLSGVEASWTPAGESAQPAWSGWWPHVEPDIARTRTAGSAEHEAMFARLVQPGKLTLRTLIELPEGQAALRVECDAPFEATLGGEVSATATGSGGRHQAELGTESTGEPLELVVILTTGVGGKSPSLRVRSLVKGQTQAVERKHLLVPWTPPPPPSPASATAPPFDLAGGDARRGEAVFFSEGAKCSSCHKVRGKGGDVGPDLSQLETKDPATLYRDIADPSATIDPSYLPYTVALKNGQVAAGLVRAEGGNAIRVLDVNAKATIVPRAQIEELRSSSTSIMPVGLAGGLGEDKVRDLIAFLRVRKDEPERGRDPEKSK